MISLAAAILVAQTGVSAPHPLRVTVRNDLPISRLSETVEVPAAQLKSLGDLTRVHVFDGATEVLAQSLDLDADGTPESLIFQVDMPAKGSRSFELRTGEKRVYRKEDFRAYGRFVRERFDDFAWENDRVAHRMYGAALETWEREPLTSSAVDVWLKRTRRLVINEWYMVDDYHRDRGEGADFYSAGKSRGCGGSGLWRDGKLLVSKNFRDSRVLANGPIRLVFELVYPGFETKRVTLDAGQNFNRFESRYADPADAYAIGIKKNAAGTLRVERAAGWIREWEPVSAKDSGSFGCAIVLDPSSISDVTEGEGNHLVIAKTPAKYFVGTGWDRSGDFKDMTGFDRYVEQWTERVRTPLVIEVSAAP